MQIEIHSFNGVHFTLDVERSDTLKDVKQKIRTKTNYSIIQQSLLLDYTKLEEDDNKTLSDYKINDGTSLQLRIAGEWEITVELFNDLVINVEVNPNDTISGIKHTIEYKTLMPADVQRLFLTGKELRDKQFVCKTGIQNGSLLVCRAEMEIVVNNSGKRIMVQARETSLVKEVKFQIRVLTAHLHLKQKLVFNGEELDNNKQLRDYGIVDRSELNLFEEPYPHDVIVNISIRDTTGSEVAFKVNIQCSGLEMKLALQHKIKIPYSQTRILFDGRRLMDNDTFRKLQIEDGDVFEMYQCLCGC